MLSKIYPAELLYDVFEVHCGCVAFVPEWWMRGLRARIVDAWPSFSNCGCVAFVPYLCCRPLSQHLSCRFWKPPRAGEVLPKFCTYSAVFCFAEQDLSDGTRSTSACLHRHPSYNWALSLPLSYVDRCSPVRHLTFEIDMVGDMWIFVYLYDCICFGLSTFFGQPTDA
jgi:hypothetical protein